MNSTCTKCDVTSPDFLPLDDVDEILNKDCECSCDAVEVINND